MKPKRGGTHSTLTETARIVVSVLENTPGVTMISPGIIKPNRRGSGKRFVTAVFTNAGLELIISGQSVQKVAVHCAPDDTEQVIAQMSSHKSLKEFTFKVRERKPGI